MENGRKENAGPQQMSDCRPYVWTYVTLT